MIHRRQSPPRGQGLLEVIIGIGVIIAGTVGSITLISATVTAGRSTNNRVVAASLARESIEVIRNIRDSNWLAIQANVTGATSFAGLFNEAAGVRRHFATPIFDRTNNTWTMNTVGSGAEVLNLDTAFNKDCGVLKCSTVFLDANGYFQKSGGTAAVNSRFARMVELHPICRVDGVAGTPVVIDGIADASYPTETIRSTDRATCISSVGTDNEVLVGLQVIATVRWTEGTTARNYRLEDRIYNWKYVK
ncbi:MAG: hypothetical protein HY976_03120 [Candidatus Kerfeldbacteria bacterium]|nr:hypothetical protein [Candidatus Kerfeldbacteria bacterium]